MVVSSSSNEGTLGGGKALAQEVPLAAAAEEGRPTITVDTAPAMNVF